MGEDLTKNSGPVTRHLLIDCDPGCDDALAILLAIASNVYESIDIATVAGNVGVNQATANGAKVCALAQEHGLLDASRSKNITIYRGASASLDGKRPSAASVHGRDGLGDVPMAALLAESNPETFCKAQLAFLRNGKPPPASELYRSILNETPNENTHRDLLCTGPLTNLALFLLSLSEDEQRDFWSPLRWKRFVVMGGAVGVSGNVSYAAEFNTHADPHAMAVVLSSLKRARQSSKVDPPLQLILVPLDITEHMYLRWYWEYKKCSSLAKAVACLLGKYFLFHSTTYPPPFDPLAPKTGRGVTVANLDKRKENQELLSQKYRTARLGGSGGLKGQPRWCFLHDPLAAWLAVREIDYDSQPKLFEAVSLRVETSPGEGRGHLYEAIRRESFLELVARQSEESGGSLITPRSDLFEVQLFKLSTKWQRGDIRKELTADLRKTLRLKR